MANEIHIYLIWFPISKKYYVGQTCNLNKRMQAHLKSGSLVCKALWKYDDWQVSILHSVKTKNEADRIEVEEIRNFNSVSPNGYNLTRGGDGFSDPTGEIAKKISVTLTGRKNPKHSEFMKGRQNSLGKKRPDVAERNRRGKGVRNPKHSERMTGRKASRVTKLKMFIARTKYWLTKLEE